MRQKSNTPETPSERLVRDFRRATRKQYSACRRQFGGHSIRSATRDEASLARQASTAADNQNCRRRVACRLTLHRDKAPSAQYQLSPSGSLRSAAIVPPPTMSGIGGIALSPRKSIICAISVMSL